MFKLRLQFFLVLLLLSSLLSTGLYIFIKVSFQHDFWHYIQSKEIRLTQPLMKDLIKNYSQHNNWNWIGDWDKYVQDQWHNSASDRTRANPPSPQPLAPADNELAHQPIPENVAAGKQATAPEQRDKRDFNRRPPMAGIFLLDANQQWVAGKNSRRNSRGNNTILIPLKDAEQIIGYLGVPSNPALRDLQDADFAHLQETKLAMVMVIALLIAGVIAFPLAHFITQRIQQLVNQVGHLSQGNYRERIAIKGRDELSELAEHLNNLSETLAQSEQTRRQWVADISHELRTPLAVLQAELEAMEDGVRPLDAVALDRLQKHCQRLKHLVNDLYELSLTDLGGMTYRKNTVNLTLLLQEAISAMQPQFAQQKIQLSFISHQAAINIFGDQDRLQQLFANLLKNSLLYTSSPGVTQATIATEDNFAVIIIEDSSPGVDAQHHEKLFDRLYRGDSSRNRTTGGAGLGLSICKNIVAAHDGHISIGDSDLGGLKITIRLPC